MTPKHENRSSRVSRRTAVKAIGGAALVGGAVGGLPGTVGANPGSLYDLRFETDDDVDGFTATEPGWNPDRTAPDEWVRATGRPHNNVVKLNVDEDEATSGFWAFQGMNYEDAGGGSWEREIPNRVSATGSTYIDPAWEENNEERRVGLWYALGNDEGDWTWFDIIEYRSSAVTGDDPSFFRFASDTGYDDVGQGNRLGAPGDTEGWVSQKFVAEPGPEETDIKWHVNGEPLVDTSFDNPFGDTDYFYDFWVQVVNYGEDQDYYFDNCSAVLQ